MALRYQSLASAFMGPAINIADYSKNAEVIASIRAGVELGMTHIDTAESMALGITEELVSEAIVPGKNEPVPGQ